MASAFSLKQVVSPMRTAPAKLLGFAGTAADDGEPHCPTSSDFKLSQIAVCAIGWPMLLMPSNWRFGNPGDLSQEAVGDFRSLIDRISAQGDSWSILETFKARFNGGASTSSSESWASSDLDSAMRAARLNAPVFIDAFWTGIEELKISHPSHGLPDELAINAILQARNEPFELRPPQLLPRQTTGVPTVIVATVTVDEKARVLVHESLARSDELLSQQLPRQAVQEILWLLETVSTAFQGRETENGTIEGKYFNSIVRGLIKNGNGNALAQAASWMSNLNGYLSSPTGGGVRHGTDLTLVSELKIHEARLYCNLTKSYIDYLLAELANWPATGQG